MAQAAELIPIERHPKAGAALLVESTVQDVLDDPSNLDGRFAELSASLPGRDDVDGRYAKAERMRQAAFSTAAFLIGKEALRGMTTHMREHGRLAIDDRVPFDPHAYAAFGPQSIPSYRALRASHHLVHAGEALLDAIKDPAHPYHSLDKQLEDTSTEHFEAWTAWHTGSNANRWPYRYDSQGLDAGGVLLGSICLNLQLSVSMSASRAVHYLLHENPDANAAELDAAVARTLPRSLWIGSSNRHLGWRPDWQDVIAAGGHVGNMPEDGVAALLQTPRSQITSPNDYAASESGLPIMRDPSFCPHAALQDGPIEKAGACAGDPWARYPDAPDRQVADDFFAET
ncbi:MAG TPA: hypothetical protein VD735_07490, partial [Candidatus Saccharimonadales bacterium]|nr:hypothetical protein [Candidatus Saccharimonadales bacterium]